MKCRQISEIFQFFFSEPVPSPACVAWMCDPEVLWLRTVSRHVIYYIAGRACLSVHLFVNLPIHPILLCFVCVTDAFSIESQSQISREI